MCVFFFFFFQAEDGIRDLVRSRGLGDVYKRQGMASAGIQHCNIFLWAIIAGLAGSIFMAIAGYFSCLLYTSDAADERSSVDLGGRRIIKKKKQHGISCGNNTTQKTLTATYHSNRIGAHCLPKTTIVH